MADVSLQFSSIPAEFLYHCAQSPGRNALRVKLRGEKSFSAFTWAQWKASVVQTALGLHTRGIKPGDLIAILCENRPEWTYADLGILSLGAASVPIYPSCTAEEVLYVLRHSEAKGLFLSSLEQLQKVLPALDSLSDLKFIAVFDPLSPHFDPRVLPYDSLRSDGRLALLDGECLFQRLVADVQPEALATVIYTSGTTGPPKGVMLTHRNFMENYRRARTLIRAGENDVGLSFLPLSHVFERLAGYYYLMSAGAQIAYAENMTTVVENLAEIKPTIAAAVPRFYEKVYAKIMERVDSGSRQKKKIFYWAVRYGRNFRQRVREGRRMGLQERLKMAVAEALVLSKIRKVFGGRLRFFISGGAPLPKHLADFFYGAGVLILEGYGLTETSPVIAVNGEDDFKFGTVGRPLPGVGVKIAEDGEILTQGPCVMKGYYKDPAATAAVMRDGWFCTGDIGCLSDDGYLRITDRKKDIIVTSGGKNVAPQNIEGRLTAHALIQQAVVIGDKKNYLVALLVPAREEVRRCLGAAVVDRQEWAEVLRSPALRALLEKAVQSSMEGLASYEQIKNFGILPQELTQQAGELTPTLKVKRRLVMDKYSRLIESLYREADRLYSGKPGGQGD